MKLKRFQEFSFSVNRHMRDQRAGYGLHRSNSPKKTQEISSGKFDQMLFENPTLSLNEMVTRNGVSSVPPLESLRKVLEETFV